MTEVSIIIPLYNCEDYLSQTLDSVLTQTFQSWEALLIDDCSADRSFEIAQHYEAMDSRFRVFRMEENGGAAKARNKGLAESTGRYIAYLDSDDLWYPEKLEKQISFMKRSGTSSCFTSYETINEDGSHRNYVHVDSVVAYKDFLKKTPTCSHTIIFDTDVVKKDWLVMPNLKRGQDAATWLNVIKNSGPLTGLDEILAANRKRDNSLSSNKIAAVKRTWFLYTEVEKINKLYAAYCLFWQLFHAVQKRMGKKS